MGWLASKVSRYLSILCLWSHQPTAATVAGGFAAENPEGRKYRSMAAGAVLHAPALSRKCGQRHAVSRRWRLRTDLLQIKSKGSPYSITERRVPELIPVLGSQPAGGVSHKPAVGCHYFPPGLQLPSQPLKGLLPISLLGKQRHDGCQQFAQGCYPTASRLRSEPRPYCA